ncbi:uncharacterized protein VP01_196g12 [Puccinia sorghi]|uniref:Uncharacterized protein n=1 Tax=Puccinia sorghi TaxID=27349 RepID=A0A0L6VBX0_9BASI|nr:uncharacterized protein VP01_196g12 [Puccinia sorghi]
MPNMIPSLTPRDIHQEILTPGQQVWLDSVLASMRRMINTKFKPIPDGRTDLQKALDDGHFLKHINVYFSGAMEEARFLQVSNA